MRFRMMSLVALFPWDQALARAKRSHVLPDHRIVCVKKFSGAVGAHQPPRLKQPDSRREQQCFTEIVSYKDNGLVQPLLQRLEFALNLRASDGIESAERATPNQLLDAPSKMALCLPLHALSSNLRR